MKTAFQKAQACLLQTGLIPIYLSGMHKLIGFRKLRLITEYAFYPF